MQHVPGFLPGYLQEEGLKSGAGFFLWNLLRSVAPLEHMGPVLYLAHLFHPSRLSPLPHAGVSLALFRARRGELESERMALEWGIYGPFAALELWHQPAARTDISWIKGVG